MNDPGEIRTWVIRSVSEQLSQVLEAMAGEAPLVESQMAGANPAGEFRYWECTFSVAPEARLLLAATDQAWRLLGGKILAAAGLDLDDEETLRSTFQETIDQAFSGVAQGATKQIGREVNASPAKPATYGPKPGDQWSTILLAFSDKLTVEVSLLCEPALLAGLQRQESQPAAAEVTPSPASGPAQGTAQAASAHLTAAEVKNADLLFDVELPVCVSFGRAHLQLRDVMKLTTGSVVELNRTVTEPVEVIVNNCVIARGEVVVVEGNFGVRINEVISRQERLRTLY